MIIPYTELSKETLQAIIEEFVTREGTEYGEHDVILSTKVQQVMRQLEQKEVFIVYSELHESCTLMTKEEMNQ